MKESPATSLVGWPPLGHLFGRRKSEPAAALCSETNDEGPARSPSSGDTMAAGSVPRRISTRGSADDSSSQCNSEEVSEVTVNTFEKTMKRQRAAVERDPKQRTTKEESDDERLQNLADAFYQWYQSYQDRDIQQLEQDVVGRQEVYIEEVIELKLKIANQQATIDTLASRLRNLQHSNRQLCNMDQRQTKSLKDENRNLADQLNECREREIHLRSEANAQRIGFNRERAAWQEEKAALLLEVEKLQGPIVWGHEGNGRRLDGNRFESGSVDRSVRSLGRTKGFGWY